ncbi:MAG: hypothetical protein AB1611_12745 [bacterium]
MGNICELLTTRGGVCPRLCVDANINNLRISRLSCKTRASQDKISGHR